MTKTEYLKKIKDYVTVLHNTLHPGEKPVYTNIDDWTYATAINIIGSCGDIETHSTKELKIVNKSLICIDDEYIEIPVKEMSDSEIEGIYHMLRVAYMELTGSEL